MAILNTYTFDNVSWTKHDWSIGEIISEGKIDNVENGIAISISLADTILREIGGQLDPGTGGQIILNSSRIDNLTTWITGSAEGSYTGTTISIRLTNIDSDINTLKANEKQLRNYITGSDTGTYTNSDSISFRIDNLETHDATIDEAIAAIKAEFGGTYVSGSGFTNSRLDQIISKGSAIATQVWGSDITTGASRIDTLVSKASALATELFGSDTTTGISRLYTVIDKEKELRTYLTGSNTGTYSGAAIITRLDNLQKWITGSNNGTYSGNAISNRLTTLESYGAGTRLTNLETKEKQLRNYITGSDTGEYSETAIDSRLDTLKTFMAATKTKIGDWDTSSFNNNTYLDKVINEVWGGNNGTGTTFTDNSRIDTIQKWITGSIDGSYSKNITETAGWIDKRLKYLEDNISPELIETLQTSLTNARRVLSATATTIDEYTGDGLIHRMNEVEREIANIAEAQGVATKMVETTNLDISSITGYEILTIGDALVEYQICFIIVKHEVPGNGKLKIKYNDGSVFDVYYKDQANCQMQIPIPLNTILGVYRKPGTNKLYLFNAPTIL